MGCLGLVAVGMELQVLWRLAPCPLCIFQRVLYLAIGIVGLLGFLWPVGRMLWAGLIGGLGLFGFGVAAYQSWMQAYPELANECGGVNQNLIERFVDWLGMQWPDWFLATGFCTSREWELFGLSMANQSAIVFAGIVVAGVLLLKNKR